MKTETVKMLKVFYDGGCVVCNHEIDFYKKRDTSNKIDWVDINAVGFDANLFGLHPMKVRERFHSITQEGEILDGVESFKTIWKVLGIFKPMIFFAETKVTRMLMDLGYIVFTKVRPYLPRKKAEDCGDACVVDYSKIPS